MDNFRNELKALLVRYPQVKSVSFDCTETITASTPNQAVNQPPVKPVFQAASPTAAVDAVMASMGKK
jgi:hypothetical protein